MKRFALAATAALSVYCLAGAADAAAPYFKFTLTQNGKVIETFSLNENTGTRESSPYSDYVYYKISNDSLGRTGAFFGDGKVDGLFGTGTWTANGVTPAFYAETSTPFYSGTGSNIVIHSGEVVTADCVTVTISDAPEPAAWMLMLGGVGLLGGVLRARRRRGALDAVAAA